MDKYRFIPRRFLALLSDTGRAGLREAVDATDAPWYEVAAEIFDLGVLVWRLRRDAARLEQAETANGRR